MILDLLDPPILDFGLGVWILDSGSWDFGVWNFDFGFWSFGPVLMKLTESEIEFSQTFKYLGSTLRPVFWMFFGICCFETHILLAKHPSLCVGPLLSETSRL